MQPEELFNLKKVIFVCITLLAVAFLVSTNIKYDPQFSFDSLEVNKNIPQIKDLTTASVATPLTENSEAKYFYFNKASRDALKKIKISAQSFIVGDLNTGEIIMIKNQDKAYPIASVSKLMTALVTKEVGKETDIATVSSKALSTYGENGNFKKGEKIKTSDLLYPLLLESSNDAAAVLAEHYGGNSFIQKMNEVAKNLKMSSTAFGDPSGLSIKNKSTVGDIFKLTGYIRQNKQEVLNITTKRSYTNKKHTWFSTNQFLHEDGYIGGKSGYTDPAKQTVVSTFSLPLAKSGTRPIAIVLLQSKDRQKDVLTIVKYLKKNIYYGGAKDAKADWIKEKLNIREVVEPDYVTLTFAGDIMLDRGVRNSVNKNFGGDYSALFEKLKILKKSDIVFANLEGTASDKGKDIGNLYSFRMDPEIIPALRGAGISIVSVANNHVGDWGREAYIDTLARLRENEIAYTGGGSLLEAENPTIIEKNGMKIGYLGFSDVGPSWMEVTEDNMGLLLASNPDFDKIIQNASKKVDYLVVSFHFGEEYKTKHNARQETLAHRAIDAGAKLVIGHRPHVVQDAEVYSPKSCTQSSCAGFIAYSLGNFIFDQKFSVPTMEGMLLEITLNKDGSMTTKKNTVKLNKVFQPDKVILGKEEVVKFQK